MESSITFYFLSFHALHPLQTSNSLAFKILPPNLNFISLLHWNSFLMEIDRILSCFKKKIKIRTPTQSCQLPKPPHCKNDTWNLCLTDLLPMTFCNVECWKWNFHFAVTKVLILDWIQVMPRGNVGSQFFVLAYCWMLTGYYYH
jgi:hypothetical protein